MEEFRCLINIDDIESLANLLVSSPAFRNEITTEYQKLKEKHPNTPFHLLIENAVINVLIKYEIITVQ